MLEAMTRRYYRIRALENVRAFEIARPALRHRQFRAGRQPAVPDLDASPTTTTWPRPWSPLNAQADQAPEPANLVTDLYLAWPDAPEDPDDQSRPPCSGAAGLQPALAGGRRVTVTVCVNTADSRRAAVHLPAGRATGWPRSG